MHLMNRLCMLALCAVVVAPVTASAAKYGIILLDRTGSMQSIRVTGNTRCKDSITQAHDRVNVFFAAPYFGTHLSIWTFDGDSVDMTSPFVTTPVAAHAAVDAVGPNGCNGGSTNLADAMCSAGSYLSGLNQGFTMLHVATDGYENSSTGVCSGPTGGLVPGFWEYNVYSQLTSQGVAVSTLYYVATTPLELQSEPPANPDIALSKQVGTKGPEGDVQSLNTCTAQTQCEGRLFRYLAGATGGQYFIVQDSNTRWPCSGSQCPAPEPSGW